MPHQRRERGDEYTGPVGADGGAHRPAGSGNHSVVGRWIDFFHLLEILINPLTLLFEWLID